MRRVSYERAEVSNLMERRSLGVYEKRASGYYLADYLETKAVG